MRVLFCLLFSLLVCNATSKLEDSQSISSLGKRSEKENASEEDNSSEGEEPKRRLTEEYIRGVDDRSYEVYRLDDE